MLTCSDGRGCSWLTVAMMTIRFAAKLSVLLEVSAMSEVSAMYAGDDDDPLCCEAVRAAGGIRDVRGLRDVCRRCPWSLESL